MKASCIVSPCCRPGGLADPVPRRLRTGQSRRPGEDARHRRGDPRRRSPPSPSTASPGFWKSPSRTSTAGKCGPGTGIGAFRCRASSRRFDAQWVAVMGPIVLPQGMLLRLTNTCHGTPARSHARWNDRADVALVA